MMREVIGTLLVLCLGSTALWAGTDGFRAFTSEQARRLAVQKAPRALPPAVLEDQDGATFSLANYRGRKLLVDFVYTRCRSICAALSAGFQTLSQRIPADDATGPVLLSVTLDPDNDTRAKLKAYADRYGADPKVWRFARVDDEASLAALLRTFDVVVIADTSGEFQHNAALHLVDERGRLAHIFGYDELDQAGEALGGKR
jgi:protein SCO1/2